MHQERVKKGIFLPTSQSINSISIRLCFLDHHQHDHYLDHHHYAKKEWWYEDEIDTWWWKRIENSLKMPLKGIGACGYVRYRLAGSSGSVPK